MRPQHVASVLSMTSQDEIKAIAKSAEIDLEKIYANVQQLSLMLSQAVSARSPPPAGLAGAVEQHQHVNPINQQQPVQQQAPPPWGHAMAPQIQGQQQSQTTSAGLPVASSLAVTGPTSWLCPNWCYTSPKTAGVVKLGHCQLCQLYYNR